MKILLDECVDRRLARRLDEHVVRTVPEMGWAGVKNGALLALAETDFDVLITVDRNLAFQQALPRFRIAVVVLESASNRLSDLVLLVPDLLQVLPGVRNGEVTRVRISNS